MMRLSAWLRREWLNLILACLWIVLVFNSLFAPKGARDLLSLRQHRIALEAQVRRLNAENAELETSIQKLRSDDAYLQRLIRGELGFARPDEIVYRFAGDGAAGERGKSRVVGDYAWPANP